VVINIGTNDQNSANNVSAPVYAEALTKIIQGVHGKWPSAQVVVMVRPETLSESVSSMTDNSGSLSGLVSTNLETHTSLGPPRAS